MPMLNSSASNTVKLFKMRSSASASIKLLLRMESSARASNKLLKQRLFQFGECLCQTARGVLMMNC